MSRSPGWYSDPDGAPAMRYWDGGDWSGRSRPISTADLPPLDFLVDPRESTVPVEVVAPPDAVKSPDTSAAPSTGSCLPLVTVAPLLLLGSAICLLPAAAVLGTWTPIPGWVVFAGWLATGTGLLLPSIRRVLARRAPGRSGLDVDKSIPAEKHLAVLTWLAAPVVATHVVVSAVATGLDRPWSFLNHLAATSRQRQSVQSTTALVFAMVRGTIFWLLWLVVAGLRSLVQGLRYISGLGCRAAAAAGNRMRVN